MKDYSKVVGRVVRCAISPLAVVMMLIPMIGAQDVPFKSRIDDPLPLSEQARTVPISSNQLTLKITLDNGQSVQATQCEGGMIRMEIDGGGIFGLTPYKRGQGGGDGLVAVKVFRITRIRKNGIVVGEGITELEKNVVGNQPTRFLSGLANTEPRFTIQLVGVKEPGKIKEINVQPQIAGEGGTCCVTCDGVKVCACAVETICGSCCVGACCN